MRGLRVARVAGIEIRVDASLLIVFALITAGLGGRLFPTWHPDWSPTLAWGTALVAAVLFFVSVLLHELAHAVVGRLHGIPIRTITLFIFGGMAHLEKQPAGWRAELLMALAGPAASLAIGLTMLTLVALLGQPMEVDPASPAASLAALGPLATLAVWLGPINIVLAVFNLVPGFPLDGGRVLRALVWGLTGDLLRATRIASTMGQAFAWLLMASGVAMMLGLRLPLLGTGGLNGLWLAFIGWFLNNAAVLGYRQLLVEQTLGRLTVREVMDTSVRSVDPGLSVEALVESVLLHGPQRGFPVVRDDRLVGIVCLEDVRRVPRDQWSLTPVASAMTRAEALVTATPQMSVAEALERLSTRGVDQLPVVDREGRVLGLVRRENILTWIMLHADAESSRGHAPAR